MDITAFQDDYRRALTEHGPRHDATLSAGRALGQALLSAQRFAEAADLWAHIAEIEAAIHGPDHERALDDRGLFGRALADAHRHDEAIAVLEDLLVDRARVVGIDDPATLRTRGNLARAIGFSGRTEEAIGLTRRLLSDRERILGPDDPETLDSLGNLAQLLTAAGRHQEALPIYQEVLERRAAVLGEGHPDTVRSEDNLIVATGKVDPAAAIESLRQLIAEYLLVLDPADPTVLLLRAHLAEFLSDVGQRDDAVEQYRELIVQRTRVLGPFHWSTLKARHNLVITLGNDDDGVPEALELVRVLLDDARTAFGVDGELTLKVEITAALQLSHAGRPDLTVQRLERIRPLIERRFEAGHRVRRHYEETLEDARRVLEEDRLAR